MILNESSSSINIFIIFDSSDYVINRWNFIKERMIRELIFANIPEVNVCVKACNSYSSIGLQLADTVAYIVRKVLLGEYRVREFTLDTYFHTLINKTSKFILTL